MSENSYTLTEEQKAELSRRGFITIENPLPFWINLLFALGEILVYTTFFTIFAIIVLLTVSFWVFQLFGPDKAAWLNLHNPIFLLVIVPILFLTFIVPIFNALNKVMNLWRFFVSEKRGIMDYTSILAAESNKTFSGASFIESLLREIRERKPEMFGYLIALNGLLFFYFPLQLLLALSCFMIVAIFWRPLFFYLHPLYAFAHLGEQVRDRAIVIETQSRFIQESFWEQWSYHGLKWPFESLSSSFRELIALILKLEQYEGKIHGGNIFDSRKYVDSFRGDIRAPLISLRAFFETQKSELIWVQSEIIQIRVGPNDLLGEKMLTSDRSMMILKEIDTTIVKLDEMIEKIG